MVAPAAARRQFFRPGDGTYSRLESSRSRSPSTIPRASATRCWRLVPGTLICRIVLAIGALATKATRTRYECDQPQLPSQTHPGKRRNLQSFGALGGAQGPSTA